MASILTTDKMREVLGLTAPTATVQVAPQDKSLAWFSKMLELLNNPIIMKYVDKLLAKATGGQQIGNLVNPLTNQSAAGAPQKGEDIYNFIMMILDKVPDAMTVTQLKTYLSTEKDKIIGAINLAAKSGIL